MDPLRKDFSMNELLPHSFDTATMASVFWTFFFPSAAAYILDDGRKFGTGTFSKLQRIRSRTYDLDRAGKFGKFRDNVQVSVPTRLLEMFDEIIDEDPAFSFSMSLGMSLDGAGSSELNPSEWVTQLPSDERLSQTPSFASSNSPTSSPTTLDPSTPTKASFHDSSNEPTADPSNDPSLSPTFELVPLSPSSPLVHSEQDDITKVFSCSDGTLKLGLTSDEATKIQLIIGFRAESSSNSTDDFVTALEAELFATAVHAALGNCEVHGRRLKAALPTLEVMTTEIGSCEATFNETESCTILETGIIFNMNGEVNPDSAAYAAYTAIEANMDGDEYITVVPTLLLLQYLSPISLPPPVVVGGKAFTESPIELSANGVEKLSLSPWTIGACVATIMGGVFSLVVWSRNRRSRHRRHLQLCDEHEVIYSPSRNPVSI